jgi:hypothetical protein
MATAEELLTLALQLHRQMARAAHIPLQKQGEEPPDSAAVDIKHITEAIELSKHILSFHDNWDDEGSPGYKLTTWERATGFLRRAALHLREDYRRILDAPKILPGPAGSIDLHWKTARRELLINIPEGLDEPANFYGDDSASNEHPANQTVKGVLDTSKDNQWLLMWLMQ